MRLWRRVLGASKERPRPGPGVFPPPPGVLQQAGAQEKLQPVPQPQVVPIPVRESNNPGGALNQRTPAVWNGKQP